MASSIEIDYRLSQPGHGLKYSSDPTLVLKDAGIDMSGGSEPILKRANKAFKLGPDDRAFNLEISGQAVAAVENYVRMIREFALERCGGKRTTLSTAQSGRAMEMMNQGLIMSMLRMILAANQVYEIRIGDDTHAKGSMSKPEKVKIVLRWPDWYPPTATDRANDATAIKTHRDSGILSRETAVSAIAPTYQDVTTEVKRIEAEKQAQMDAEGDRAIKRAKETAAAKPAPVKAAA